MDWFLDVIKNKYAKFDGRARRKEYWMFNLFSGLIVLAVYIVLVIFIAFFAVIKESFDSDALMRLPLSILAVILMVTLISLVIPTWAVTIRRLHDIGKSGWWILIGFIPYIGPIVLLVFCCLDSESGTNKYGPNPKGVGA